MTKYGTVKFKGDSGNEYEFAVYSFDTTFKDNISCVYVVTNRTAGSDDGFTHTVIYVGETRDLTNRFVSHHKQNCFDNNNANCLCIYLENSEESRLAIEKDLVDYYNPPCNG